MNGTPNINGSSTVFGDPIIPESSQLIWVNVVKPDCQIINNQVSSGQVDKILALKIKNTSNGQINSNELSLATTPNSIIGSNPNNNPNWIEREEIYIEGFGREMDGYVLQPNDNILKRTHLKRLIVTDNFIRNCNVIPYDYALVNIIQSNDERLPQVKLINELQNGNLCIYMKGLPAGLYGSLHILDRLNHLTNKVSPCIAINIANYVIEIPNQSYFTGRTLSNAIYGIVKEGLILNQMNQQADLFIRPRYMKTDLSTGRNTSIDRNTDSTTDLSNNDSNTDKNNDNNYKIALKIIYKNRLSNPEIKTENPLQEISAMQHLQKALKKLLSNRFLSDYELQSLTEGANYVIKLLHVCQDNQSIFILMPFINGGELFNYFNSFYIYPIDNNIITDINQQRINRLKRITRQILLGVYVLHRCGISHRDISLENTLIQDFGTPHEKCLIMDFGMSQLIYRNLVDVFNPEIPIRELPHSLRGKPYYRPIEVACSAQLIDPYACDMWQIGTLLFILWTGCAPYTSTRTIAPEWYDMISSNTLFWKQLTVALPNSDRFVNKQLNTMITSEAFDLLENLLRADRTTRLTSLKAIQHQFLNP